LDQPPGKQVDPMHLEQFIIEGEKGTLKLYTSGKITLVDENGQYEEVIAEKTELDHEESHLRLQSHFIHCLNTGEEFQTSGEDNLETLRLVFGTYESAENHKVVTLE